MTDSFYAGGGIGLGPRPEPPAPPSYPAPDITSRDGAQGPDKAAVTALVRLAESHRWTVLVTYAKGYLQHATTGKPGTVRRGSLAVRMRRPGGQHAVAVYVDHGSAWAWDTLWIAGARLEKYGQIGAFQDALFGAVHIVATWPWAKCPMVTTAAWHPPYVRGWR